MSVDWGAPGLNGESRLAAHAQQAALPVIGFLSGAGKPSAAILNACLKGLSELGYIEGSNVSIEYRTTERYDQLSALASDLVRRQVAVIFAFGTANSARAAKVATAIIPIVFANGSDPVMLGLVASMSRPGGNVTGVSFLTGGWRRSDSNFCTNSCRKLKTIAILINPTNARAEVDKAALQAAALSVGQTITVLTASTVDEIDTVFATAARQQVAALLINGDAFFTRHVPISGRS